VSLKEKIFEDLTNSMKSQNAFRTETLRGIRAEILKMDKSGLNREMTEEEEIQLLSRQVKMRKESIEMFESGGRMDLVEKEKKQLDIIMEYMPKPMPDEDAEKIVNKIIEDLGANSQKDFGKVMGAAMKELKGKIDGKIIQDMIKSKLGS